MLIGSYTAVLDACVMHPAFVRASLLWFADERLYRPVWSNDIMAEWKRSIIERFGDVSAEALDRQEARMNTMFPDARIDGYQEIIPALDLPDADDRHVLAAAILSGSDAIITENRKDFPPEVARQYRVDVVHPDDFIVNMIDLNEGRALAACKRHRAAMKDSQPSGEAFLLSFKERGLIQTYQRLLPQVELL